MWFAKRVTIFKRKDKISWQKIKDVLKSEGFKNVKAGHYSADSSKPRAYTPNFSYGEEARNLLSCFSLIH